MDIRTQTEWYTDDQSHSWPDHKVIKDQIQANICQEGCQGWVIVALIDSSYKS